VETWTFNCTYPATTNYSYNETTDGYSILQNTTYWLNVSILPSTSEFYGIETNVTGERCPDELGCKLFRDGVEITNPEVDTLAVNLAYTYVFNNSGNTNYSAKSNTSSLEIKELTGEVNGFINHTASNFTAYNGTATQDIYINMTLISPCVGNGNITIDGIQI
ncbi:unnamed protein product, partial [marine sediment metagenome]